MKKETNVSLEVLDISMVKIKGQGTPYSLKMQGNDAFDSGAKASVVASMHEPPKQVFKRCVRVLKQSSDC